MATITSVTASPTTIATGGGQSTITPTISDPDTVATVTVAVDGSTGTAQVALHEGLAFSVNPADMPKTDPAAPSYQKGLVVATVDQGGTLAIAPNGVSVVLTAS